MQKASVELKNLLAMVSSVCYNRQRAKNKWHLELAGGELHCQISNQLKREF